MPPITSNLACSVCDRVALWHSVFGFWGWMAGSFRDWDQRPVPNQSPWFPHCLWQDMVCDGEWVYAGVRTGTEKEMRSQEGEQSGCENGPLVFYITRCFYCFLDIFCKSLSILLVSFLGTPDFVNIPGVNTLSRCYMLIDTIDITYTKIIFSIRPLYVSQCNVGLKEMFFFNFLL